MGDVKCVVEGARGTKTQKRKKYRVKRDRYTQKRVKVHLQYGERLSNFQPKKFHSGKLIVERVRGAILPQNSHAITSIFP